VGWAEPDASAATFRRLFVVRQSRLFWLVHVFEERTRSRAWLSPIFASSRCPPPLALSSPPTSPKQATRLPFVVLIMAIFFLFQAAAFWLPSPGGFPAGRGRHPPGFPAAASCFRP